MRDLEKAFQAALTARLDAAESAGAVQKRLRAQAERRGAAGAVAELLRKGRLSEGFEALSRAGKLELSVEALAVENRFAALFTDAEVNQALSALLEAGYAGW